MKSEARRRRVRGLMWAFLIVFGLAQVGLAMVWLLGLVGW